MSRSTSLLLVGVYVAILPHLGFPSSWDTVMYTVCGLFVAYIAVRARSGEVRRSVPKKMPAPAEQPAFVESVPERPNVGRIVRAKQPRTTERRSLPKTQKVVSKIDVGAVAKTTEMDSSVPVRRQAIAPHAIYHDANTTHSPYAPSSENMAE